MKNICAYFSSQQEDIPRTSASSVSLNDVQQTTASKSNSGMHMSSSGLEGDVGGGDHVVAADELLDTSISCRGADTTNADTTNAANEKKGKKRESGDWDASRKFSFVRQTVCQKKMSENELPIFEVMESKKLKFLHKLWTKEEEIYVQRIERKEMSQEGIKNEIYQLLGLYFVFEGVIITVVTQSSNLKCKLSWIPMLLSCIASGAAIFAVWYKLEDKKNTGKAIKAEKGHLRAISAALVRLQDLGNKFDTSIHGPQEDASTSKTSRDLSQEDKFLGGPLLFTMLIFSLVVVASCPLILCLH